MTRPSAGTARRARVVRIVAAVALVVACHPSGLRPLPDAARADGAPPLAVADSAVDSGPPARCARATDAARGLSFGERAELGEAVRAGRGFAVGLLRAVDGGRAAAVALVGDGPDVVVDLGPVAHDAPAPQPFVRGGETFAVATLRARSARPLAASRSLAVYRVGPAAERLLDITVGEGVSAAYDVVAAAGAGSTIGALVGWDEIDGHVAAPGGTRTDGHRIVRVASLSPDLRAVRETRTVLAAADPGALPVDAGDVRLAVRDGGYWLTWLASRKEHAPSDPALPAGEIETPSEEPAFGWVEAVPLDAEGAPKGAPRRLTSATGRVASYAVWAHDAVLEVIAKDEPSGSLGGSLVRVVWRGEGSAESSVIARAGVEEETPPVIVDDAAGSAWLSFLDVTGDTELVPLTAGPAKAAAPSHEAILLDGRILGAIDSRLAVATTPAAGRPWLIEWATCSR